MHKLVCWLAVLVLVACAADDQQLSDLESQLLAQLEFDETLISSIKKHGSSFEQLIGVTPDFDDAPANAIVLLTKPNHGRKALSKIRAKLSGSDYSAYLNDEAYGYDADRIAILKSKDEYDYFAMVRTDAINYDMDHEHVLSRYRDWDLLFDLSLVGAGQDWLEAEFGTPPKNWMDFAQQVFEFCPDVVYQGSGDVESLAAAMRKSNTVYLWWD